MSTVRFYLTNGTVINSNNNDSSPEKIANILRNDDRAIILLANNYGNTWVINRDNLAVVEFIGTGDKEDVCK